MKTSLIPFKTVFPNTAYSSVLDIRYTTLSRIWIASSEGTVICLWSSEEAITKAHTMVYGQKNSIEHKLSTFPSLPAIHIYRLQKQMKVCLLHKPSEM